jgi:hypothetical protein
MANEQKPRITIENCEFSDIGRDAMSFSGDFDATVKGTVAKNVGRFGISVDGENASPRDESYVPKLATAWYERPIGLVTIGLFVAVAAGGLLYWLGWN